ncbi:membrane progestin receptor beta-like isoform X2 [Dreissena polymorpha]|uniref:Uncharacterized protein n=2 Tax=Dreissena polymorpha TaxID=45954 RepID=A0A9D3YCE6_DREPO|nr:membrane progestin receptor beta-like isoform X2 [Dreissena polymorpha]KAH3695880.1 hypothetical protein DPMN_083338 [Dreissena polymorpha]
MSIQQMIKRYPSPGRKDDVPTLFHEPNVETGFRATNQPVQYYLLSLFQPHNECMNAWTHLIGCFIAMYCIHTISHEFNAYNDPWMYPMLAGSITMFAMYLCSFAAHTFHNKSELWHYTCFFIDYAGIGLFGLGSTIIHFFYCSHPILAGSYLYKLAIPVGFILCINVCVCCSISKAMYSRPYPFTRKLWQLTSVLGIYVWLIIPIIHRMYIYYSSLRDEGNWDQSFDDHLLQIILFVISGFFFASDIPQRLFPGKFDIFFHSHQIFHVFIMLMNVKQIDGMSEDIRLHLPRIKTMEDVPTVWNTFGAVLLAGVINLLVVFMFHQVAKRRMEKEKMMQDK